MSSEPTFVGFEAAMAQKYAGQALDAAVESLARETLQRLDKIAADTLTRLRQQVPEAEWREIDRKALLPHIIALLKRDMETPA